MCLILSTSWIVIDRLRAIRKLRILRRSSDSPQLHQKCAVLIGSSCFHFYIGSQNNDLASNACPTLSTHRWCRA